MWPVNGMASAVMHTGCLDQADTCRRQFVAKGRRNLPYPVRYPTSFMVRRLFNGGNGPDKFSL